MTVLLYDCIMFQIKFIRVSAHSSSTSELAKMSLISSNDVVRTLSKNEALVQERREQIIQGAFKVFLRKGYKATRLRDIAEACNMSEGSIYRYIGNKDDLLHLLCLKRARGRERLEWVMAEAGDVSITEALRKCLRYYFQMGDSGREINLFFNREIRYFSSEDRHFLLQAQVSIIEFFKNILEKGVKAGEFQIDSPMAVAHNILIIGHDWGLRKWFLSRHFTLDEYIEIQTDLIIKQISTNNDYAHSKELRTGQA